MNRNLKTFQPELFFGLVGAVGTDLKLVATVLEEELSRVSYKSEHIRLSQLLADCDKYKYLKDLVGTPEDQRIDEHMDAGDQLRRTMERGDSVALLSIAKVREIRAPSDEALPARAYVFNSLKHPEEIKTFRKTYGENFFTISIYSPRNSRLERLSNAIAESRVEFDKHKYRSKAEELIEKDAEEVGDPFGQNVRKTFPMADVFIEMDEKENLRKQIGRFIDLGAVLDNYLK
jgi:hypothetical protein